MARLHTSFILGYHGCSQEVGEKVLSGSTLMKDSNKDFDWLGPGVYFWEADPVRAWEWADWKVKRGDFKAPFVVGAVIDLGNCLDLVSRDSLEILRDSYESFVEVINMADDDRELPKNKQGTSTDEDNLLRYLDCAVIKHLHTVLDRQNEPPFETVRGLFTEGDELFAGSGFKKKTHSQVAVRDKDCIKGTFRAPRV